MSLLVYVIKILLYVKKIKYMVLLLLSKLFVSGMDILLFKGKELNVIILMLSIVYMYVCSSVVDLICY